MIDTDLEVQKEARSGPPAVVLHGFLHPIPIEVSVQPGRDLSPMIEPGHRGKDHDEGCEQMAPWLVGAPAGHVL